jgi:hypothetical protein
VPPRCLTSNKPSRNGATHKNSGNVDFGHAESEVTSASITSKAAGLCNFFYVGCYNSEQLANRTGTQRSDLEPINREIRQASSPTMRGHFGCIFKATEEYTTRVWWAFYMRIMDT